MSIDKCLKYKAFDTPIGAMTVTASDYGVVCVQFDNERNHNERTLIAKKLTVNSIQEGTNRHITQAIDELSDYFKGTLKTFEVPIITIGTDFQKQVWTTLTRIPYGTTYYYQQQATETGRPKATRAVALTNSLNPISIIVPCHRVIGKNGKLTGYASGLHRKEWLLQHEKKYLNT